MNQIGVIFDLDGVITDTAEYHYQAWQWLADREGLQFDREINEKLRGVSRRASLEIILDGQSVDDSDMERMMQEKNDHYVDLLHKINEKDILPGVVDLLDGIQSQHWKIALASASKNARFILEKLDLLAYFDGIGDGYSVKRSKPEPDVFIHAAGQISLPISQCVVVEDAEAGVAAALSGGFKTIGIGAQERVGRANIIYPAPGDIQVEAIKSLF